MKGIDGPVDQSPQCLSWGFVYRCQSFGVGAFQIESVRVDESAKQP